MKSKIKLFLLFFMFSSLVACSNGGEHQLDESPNDTSDCATDPNNPIPNCQKWSKLPIKITIPTKTNGENTWSAAEILALKEAVSVYNTFYTFFEVDENSNYSNQGEFGYCDSTLSCLNNKTLNFLSKLKSFSFGNSNNVLAVTARQHNKVNIGIAHIIFNYSKNFHFGSGTVTSNAYDLRSVLIHELGHFLGLEHPCEVSGCSTQLLTKYPSNTGYSTVMLYTIGTGSERRDLTQWDKDKLNNLYNLNIQKLSFCDKEDSNSTTCLNL